MILSTAHTTRSFAIPLKTVVYKDIIEDMTRGELKIEGAPPKWLIV